MKCLRTQMSGVRYDKLDAVVFDWYKQQKSGGFKSACGTEICDAARKSATLLEAEDFRALAG